MRDCANAGLCQFGILQDKVVHSVVLMRLHMHVCKCVI